MRIVRTYHPMMPRKTEDGTRCFSTDSFELPDPAATLLNTEFDDDDVGCFCVWRVDEYEVSEKVAELRARGTL